MKAGADIKNKDSLGNTPLHHASIHKWKTCMDYLIDIGADIDEKNNKGCSPIDLCDKSFVPLFENQRLARAKADLLIKNVGKLKMPNKFQSKKFKKDAEENKSTHLESGHTASKSLFSTKNVSIVLLRKILDLMILLFIVCWGQVVSVKCFWWRRKIRRYCML